MYQKIQTSTYLIKHSQDPPYGTIIIIVFKKLPQYDHVTPFPIDQSTPVVGRWMDRHVKNNQTHLKDKKKPVLYIK